MTNYMLLATYLGAVIGFTYILAVRTNRVVRKLPKGERSLSPTVLSESMQILLP